MKRRQQSENRQARKRQQEKTLDAENKQLQARAEAQSTEIELLKRMLLVLQTPAAINDQILSQLEMQTFNTADVHGPILNSFLAWKKQSTCHGMPPATPATQAQSIRYEISSSCDGGAKRHKAAMSNVADVGHCSPREPQPLEKTTAEAEMGLADSAIDLDIFEVFQR